LITQKLQIQWRSKRNCNRGRLRGRACQTASGRQAQRS